MIVYQFFKFCAVGILNTLVDLGVLNILIWFSGTAKGLPYSIFKGISFIVAVINSYFCNKFWTFNKKSRIKLKEEFLKFFIVSLVGLAINVAVASSMVNIIGPQFNLSEKSWANMGAILASLVGLIWNFIGYNFFVFNTSKILPKYEY